jgi:hypothetical protein
MPGEPICDCFGDLEFMAKVSEVVAECVVNIVGLMRESHLCAAGQRRVLALIQLNVALNVGLEGDWIETEMATVLSEVHNSQGSLN